jgi:hypothetical protein
MMPEYTPIIYVAIIWLLMGILAYRRLEGRWTWTCLLGSIYGPFAWLVGESGEEDMILILSPSSERLYSGPNISTVTLRLRGAGILYHNNNSFWHEETTIFMLDSKNDVEKLKDLLAMCALSGTDLDAPLTKEERDKFL